MKGAPASFTRRRTAALAGALALVSLVGIGVAIDARARVDAGRRAREHAAPIARATGLSEVALSTSSTWLRHPSLAPPSAGSADAPIGLDVDPAGAAIAPRGHERGIDMHREAP